MCKVRGLGGVMQYVAWYQAQQQDEHTPDIRGQHFTVTAVATNVHTCRAPQVGAYTMTRMWLER